MGTCKVLYVCGVMRAVAARWFIMKSVFLDFKLSPCYVCHLGDSPASEFYVQWSFLNLCTGRPPTGVMIPDAV